MLDNPTSEPEYEGTGNEETSCPISIRVDGITRPVPLEEYVARVVMGEMPVSFPKEALKAQAVAARTFALRTTNFGEKSIKPTVEDQVFSAEKDVPKVVLQAVNETNGKVLTYADELITAMFFSTSNGKTESAAAFSGYEIPYLQVRDSKEDEESPKFSAKKTFTLDEWNALFGIPWNEAQIKAIDLVRNSSGRVETMKANQQEWNGRKIRELLGLPSTDFQISLKDETIVVTTKGYGHGVGMSQYGARGLALKGKSYEDIVSYYYPHTTLQNFQGVAPACLKDSLPDNTSK
ncbi:stage II sporulation protein D [Paenisporosarcina cavernae]|nr:stage II sporulation protein D [Paenisporosarcina cavernae]